MTKRNYQDPVLTKPLPSTSVPFFVILGLIACMVLAYKCFFGNPKTLLGGPPPRNEYIHYMQKPKPAPVPVPVAAPAPVTPSPAAQTSEPVPSPGTTPDAQAKPSDKPSSTSPKNELD